MPLPNLGPADIKTLCPGIEAIDAPLNGGQKLVFPCVMAGQRFALKVLLANPVPQPAADHEDFSIEVIDENTARARREVQIIAECDTPHLVKIGPLPLAHGEVAGQEVVYFSEEWIDGCDLKWILRNEGPLPLPQLRDLGTGITEAVQQLWIRKKVHRDIKPGNIMRRNGSNEFVLLDMGIALDLQDVSLTAPGLIMGTMIYYSPEQIEFMRKRQMDFRSDLFSLGIVLYEASTGRHPFWSRGMTTDQAVGRMLTVKPDKPTTLRADLPAELESVITRLLAKTPHLRYRSCDDLSAALAAIGA